MPENYHKEWRTKAQIDYFPPFINLWVAFNAWYRGHYAKYAKKSDRFLINHIKQDTTPQNPLLTNLKKLLEDNTKKENIRFKSDLEQFHYALKQSALRYDDTEPPKRLSFENALLDYGNKTLLDSYENLIKNKGEHNKIELDKVFITDDFLIVMAGLVETIYQVRCNLFHGNLSPEKQNHEVVKYAYSVLNDLM